MFSLIPISLQRIPNTSPFFIILDISIFLTLNLYLNYPFCSSYFGSRVKWALWKEPKPHKLTQTYLAGYNWNKNSYHLFSELVTYFHIFWKVFFKWVPILSTSSNWVQHNLATETLPMVSLWVSARIQKLGRPILSCPFPTIFAGMHFRLALRLFSYSEFFPFIWHLNIWIFASTIMNTVTQKEYSHHSLCTALISLVSPISEFSHRYGDQL